MKTCTYCTDLEIFGRHHRACPIVRVDDGLVVSLPLLAEWRQGYDTAARGRIAPDAGATCRLGWTMRTTRETPPALRPALFLSLTALLEHLRGRNLRTDSFGIQLASSFFCLDGDMSQAEAVVRNWPSFPRLREPSMDGEQRERARHVLATSTDARARRDATVVLEGDPDDETRTWVKGFLRAAEESGRLVWRGDRDIGPDEVNALLERWGFTAIGMGLESPAILSAAIESANGGSLLAAA